MLEFSLEPRLAADNKQLVVFVHGWSVSTTATYGGLPERLLAECRAAGIPLAVRNIHLGRYVSFRDEVRLEDLSRAFEAAIRREFKSDLERGERFACITHSTGGPLIRDWWWRHYANRGARPPMSHLIMLAPANFGSTLAQLGRSRIGRLKAWFHGMEPGEGILDWLEPGSAESWALNLDWIRHGAERIGDRGPWPFVLAGQTIDRKMYDPIVSLTAESGSDGVVRVASANLNARYLRLEQEPPRLLPGSRKRREFQAPTLSVAGSASAPPVPMRILAGCSHSGPERGIQRAVHRRPGHRKGAQTVQSILRCLTTRSRAQYRALTEAMDRESDDVQAAERVEFENRLLLPDSRFIHDRMAQLIVRVEDDRGHAVEDVDLILTAGEHSSPNHLPRGFLAHSQRNKRHMGTMTYLFNHDVMTGCGAVVCDGIEARAATPGAGKLGLKILPRPDRGHVHYLPCEIQATAELLENVLQANRTTLLDIVLRRVVRHGVFRLGGLGERRRSFHKDAPGDPT